VACRRIGAAAFSSFLLVLENADVSPSERLN
jgi:hypothetical protein